ncbi:hypothetical protein [Streptodolium elevatio]|uniref:DUF11 domain-containing protein n=1 Tax=Streptodolium elevatio TaxID=3157996 RepID=A0ABV3DA92_9ACTN
MAHHRIAAAASAAVLAGAGGLLTATGPSAGAETLPTPSRPALSIKVDDGSVKTRPGQVHTYTIRLRNLGSTDLNGMAVTEALPGGTTLVGSADGGTTGADGQITWTVDLPVGQEVVRTVKARVDTLPPGNGIASTACARLAGSTVPIVCSTDLDQIPRAELASSSGVGTFTLFGGAALGAAALGGGTWYFLRRRRRAAPAAATAAD